MNNVVPIKAEPKSEADTLVKKCCDVYGLKADEQERVTEEVSEYMDKIYPGGTYMFFDRDLNMLSSKNNTLGESVKLTHGVLLKLCIEKQVSMRNG